MIFNDMLKSILDQVDAAISVSLMDFDGIPVGSQTKSDSKLDVQTLAVEAIQSLKGFRQLMSTVIEEDLSELVLSTRGHKIVFYFLTDEYFITMLLQENGNLGKGRYLLRRYRDQFTAQL